MIEQGDLSISTNGGELKGWQEIRLTRGIEVFPSSFEVRTTEKYPGSPYDVVLEAGDACSVWLGNDLVITGYIDRYTASISPNSHEVWISGRSKCEDLVDCSADLQNSSMNAVNLEKLAEQLCRPYNIQINNKAADSVSIPVFNVNLGESPYEILERVSRYAQRLLYDDPQGRLVIDTVGSSQMGSGFRLGDNIQNASASFSMDHRYGEYRVIWQSIDGMKDSASLSNVRAVSHDPGVQQKGRAQRMLYIICEQTIPGQNLSQQRADWEMNRRYGRSKSVTILTDSWRDGNGKLWEPNSMVSVDIPTLKINRQNWIIAQVTYLRSIDTGTTAELVLMPKEAFAVEPAPLLNLDRDIQEQINVAKNNQIQAGPNS